MAEQLYEPPGARAALAKAADLRRQYVNAVQVVQRTRELSKEEKRQRLALLHQRHTQAMADQRLARHRAHREAARQAVLDFVADDAAPSALRLDLYQRQVVELLGKEMPEVIRAYDVAQLAGNSLGMRAAAVAAMHKRTSFPNDRAESLMARFATGLEPNGSGGWRHRFPKASMAFERLSDLEAWSREDHVAADAVFSVASAPEKPDDPTPTSPADQARQDVAALYSQGNSSSVTQTGGSGEPPAVAG
jgi:hypothetical protein